MRGSPVSQVVFLFIKKRKFVIVLSFLKRFPFDFIIKRV